MRTNILAIALVLFSTPTASQQLRPTKIDIKQVSSAQSSAAFSEDDEEATLQGLRSALAQTTLDRAADKVANERGFKITDMRRLARAWVIAQSRHSESDKSWATAVRAEIYSLMPKFRTKPVGLAMLTQALDQTVEDCTADDFKSLMAESVDLAREAYIIAANSSCSDNFARAAAVSGDRAAPALIRLAEYGSLAPRDLLPLYAWLTSPKVLAQLRATDQFTVATILWRRYLTALLAASLDDRALTSLDSLPAELRGGIISVAQQPTVHAVIDGVPISFAKRGGGGKDVSIETPILQLAEALAIAGRKDEARRLLTTLPDLAEAKAAAACEYNAIDKVAPRCPNTMQLPMGGLALDHLLNSPAADPYPIAETTLASEFSTGSE